MALTDPPFNIPRVSEVQDPSTGHYIVMVRMPTHVANKFPDKPWGTSIADIGLSRKDSEKYEGYTLVDVEAMKGTSDLLWMFQKLDGPAWTTKSKGQDSLIPARYRKFVETVQKKQEVSQSTEPDNTFEPEFLDPPANTQPNPLYVPNLVSSAVQQVDDTGKAIKLSTFETIVENAEPLVGQVAYEQRQIVTKEDELVEDGTAPDSGLFIVQSQTNPLGNGKSVKETVKVTEWKELVSSRWDSKIGAPIIRTEQFVAAPSIDSEDINEPNASFEIVNEHRALKVVEKIPVNALSNYMVVTPARVNLDLPRVFKSARVIWNVQTSEGDQVATGSDYSSGVSGSVSLSIPDSATSSCSITGELDISFEDIPNGSLPALKYEFYVRGNPSAASIAGRLGANPYWPVFRPQTHTVTITNCSASVRANTQASVSASWNNDSGSNSRGNATSRSDDISISKSINVIQVPPCIGGFSVTGNPVEQRTVIARAQSQISGFQRLNVSSQKKFECKATMTYTEPSGTAQNLPIAGRYIIDSDVTQSEYTGWFRVNALVFDASVLA
jgi:hypothetical protein